MPSSILVVEDDVAVREMLVETLTVEGGYGVQTAGTISSAQALTSGYGHSFDALLLDVGLPDGDGREFCANLRQRGFRLPILLLSGLSHEDDIVGGLEAGADDYLIKPFRVGELLARISGQLRHRCRRDMYGNCPSGAAPAGVMWVD